MTISFVVKLTCDVRVREYDPDSACGAICQGTFTLTRERKHELSAPEGWTIESMNPLGGPYHHDSRRVFIQSTCPKGGPSPASSTRETSARGDLRTDEP